MRAALWVVQLLLAVVFVFHANLMLWPSPQRLRGGMRYVLETPAALGIFPGLTPLAAAGLVILMLGAIVFHIRRREYPNVGFNALLGALAAIVAWGRLGLYHF
jgi:hypothetical protein